MKLFRLVVLCGILPLCSSAMYAAAEEPLDAVDATQSDFISAAEAALVLRSTMTGIGVGMGFKGPSFVVSTTAFNLRSIGMNTEGYITAWDADTARISTPVRTDNAATALLNQSLLSFLIVCLFGFATAFTTWRLIRRSVEKSTRRSGIIKSEHDRGANALTRAAHD
jgi:hypothetical protein